MNILILTEDNVCNILMNLNVVQFIFLLSTCKQLFGMRKTALKFLADGNSYTDYDKKSKLITTFLHSYIDMQQYQTGNYGKYLEYGIKGKLHETKIKNTLSIIGYHCTQNISLYETYKSNSGLLVLCCKAICRKFRYKYNQPYHRVHRLFWLNWHLSGVSILDICERQKQKIQQRLCFWEDKQIVKIYKIL